MNPSALKTSPDTLLACRKCRRLDNQFKKLRISHPDYWNLPVPAAGDKNHRLLIVGLAPGMHGANKTGIPFTGDASGVLLDKVLKQLKLEKKVRITNAVKCLPIKNLPSGKEVKNCSRFLAQELIQHAADNGGIVLALGGVAHRAIISCLNLRQKDYVFSHGAIHQFENLTVVDSYHCSRYNTQTGRLTEQKFLEVVAAAGNMAYP